MHSFLMQATQGEAPWWQMPLLLGAIFLIMWLFMIRPQQKRQKEIERRRNELQKGSLAVTAGGIYGKIKEVNEHDFILEIADGVRIRVAKSSVFAAEEQK